METRDRLERQARETGLRWRLETGWRDRPQMETRDRLERQASDGD